MAGSGWGTAVEPEPGLSARGIGREVSLSTPLPDGEREALESGKGANCVGVQPLRRTP
ncbi:hypothetical protein GCM10017653_49930 [Ancylobacter defluvii]|uniref:Uncharacterized protein n=1 Tax=Ancylobacter defluvii TaxID=1282440 RepID=A0A9W6NDH2_9HYPH|nr:hypothetical protein GCM10017653_49930 [Ancylobacter defluvii]